MLFDIIKEHEMKLPFYNIRTKGLFINLWTHIMRENFWHNNQDVLSRYEELSRVKNYLNCNANKAVSLDEISHEIKISKYYLIRLFKKTFSMTPIHYHKMVRINKIKETVQFTDMSLTKISEAFGYNNVNELSRAFKKAEGVPPSFYRRY